MPKEPLKAAGGPRKPGGRLFKNAASVLVLQLSGLGLNFALQVLLARNLGADEYGVFVYALRWMGLLALICQGGLALGSLRFVPAYAATDDWPHLKGFVATGWRFVVGASVVVGVVGAGVVAVVGSEISGPMRLTFLTALLALPLYGLLQVWGATLRGLGRVLLAQLPAPLLRPLTLGVAVSAWLLFASAPLTAATTMALNLVAASLALTVAGVWVVRALPKTLAEVAPLYRFREWRQVMPPLMLQNLIGMLIQRLDILMIGALLGTYEVALYAVASRISELIVFARRAVNAWAAPMFSRFHARGEQVELGRLARQASRVIFGLSAVIAVAILAASQQVLAAFGPEFVTGRRVLLILAAANLATALIGPAGFLLSMTGGERTVVRISAVTALVSAGLFAALIPVWGLFGAAVAAAATRFSFQLAVAVAAWRRMGIRVTMI